MVSPSLDSFSRRGLIELWCTPVSLTNQKTAMNHRRLNRLHKVDIICFTTHHAHWPEAPCLPDSAQGVRPSPRQKQPVKMKRDNAKNKSSKAWRKSNCLDSKPPKRCRKTKVTRFQALIRLGCWVGWWQKASHTAISSGGSMGVLMTTGNPISRPPASTLVNACSNKGGGEEGAGEGYRVREIFSPLSLRLFIGKQWNQKAEGGWGLECERSLAFSH